MTMPNPQYVEIDRILSGAPLFLFDLHQETRYFYDSQEVVCLGTYCHGRRNSNVAVFGEWKGPQYEIPHISLNVVKKCTHAFLLRSATDEEIVEHGGKKTVVHLEVKQMTYAPGTSYAETIVFCPKGNMGFYNPIV